MATMPTDAPNPFDLDLDRVYANYLRMCAMSGVERLPRERADGLIQEWKSLRAANDAQW